MTSGDKRWLAHYPPNLPTELSFNDCESLAALFERAAAHYAEAPAFSNMGFTLSYFQVEQRSRAFANYLHHRLRLKRGQRVAIMLPNLLQYPITLFGLLRAGLVAVNINPLYTADELSHQLEDSGASAIVVLENFAHIVAQVSPAIRPKSVIITGIGDSLLWPESMIVNSMVKYFKRMVPEYHLPTAIPFNRCLAAGARLRFQAVTTGLDEIAFLQYTGGTTGTAKGAALTNRNLLANVLQINLWMQATLPADKLLQPGEENVITALPLYHIFSLTANLLNFIAIGGHNHLITDPRDMKRLVKTLKNVRFSCITGVNTLYRHLLKTEGFNQINFSALKISLGGGMATDPQVAEQWLAITGCPLLDAYGLTETSPAIAVNPMNQTHNDNTVGPPLPATDCIILDPQGEPCPADQPGELCIKGPQVMAGYWQHPEETQAAFTEDGWLRSGDIATMDSNGIITIVDRLKDMILVSGFNVFPNEVEAVITRHPAVSECAVIGIADPDSGEAVKLVAVKSDPRLTEEQLRDYCREHLAAYKVPKVIQFINQLPKSQIGKIVRRHLRE